MIIKRVKQTAVKAIVWLTVTVFAFPAFPVPSCRCALGFQTSSCCCCQQRVSNTSSRLLCCSVVGGHACCSEESRSSCCAADVAPVNATLSDCFCGGSCDCAADQRPVQPADSSLPRDTSDDLVLSSDMGEGLLIPLARKTRGHQCSPLAQPVGPTTSLHRCIYLSRFTL